MAKLLEKRIGYKFKDKKLLQTALTHSSYAHEKNTNDTYERLEFLGDAVLELSVSEMLFTSFETMAEGDLTKRRASLVCEPSLAIIAKKLDLSPELKLGNGEELTGGRNRNSILADVVEAIIGAIFIDGGFDCAKKFVFDIMQDLLNASDTEDISETAKVFENFDYKTQLQEVVQSISAQRVIYNVTSEDGPAHNKIFVVELMHDGQAISSGNGRSKKEAEQNAAFQALKKFKNTNQK